MDITPASLPWQDAYKLLVGSILPRPIAFVSTIDENNIANAAPFSFFTAICADPMLVCFSPMRRGTDGTKKDTLVNIENTKEFVINIVSESILEQMNECAPEFKPEVDEFEKAGLTKLPGLKVRAPRIGESLVQMECELYQVLHFGEKAGSGSLVIGKVVHFHVHDDLYDNGRILTEGLNPIGRMAGHSFTKPLDAMFELVRKTQTGD